ncbi:MAG TPA: SDR family oxidoreductase [Polyangiaceae bacterium]|nr:SDR family oxidoreductase [Polyangiaceae bacterium]
MTSCERFRGKVALVTGGASGIGLATARSFLREGGAVCVVDRDERAVRAAKELGASSPESRTWGVACDVSHEADVESVTSRCLDRFGRLDVVVNSAGIMIVKPLEEHTTADWESVLRVDLLGAFYFIRAAFREMREGGAIVNVSSVHAVETTAEVAAYAAAKAALVSLTHSAAIEGKAKRIRVNAVLPGAIGTPMLWDNPNVKSGLERINKADVGKPEEVAEVIVFLASPDASFVQGAAVLVDGGRLAKL